MESHTLVVVFILTNAGFHTASSMPLAWNATILWDTVTDDLRDNSDWRWPSAKATGTGRFQACAI
jgi:hypothetical protein